jgi:hypothetical protein
MDLIFELVLDELVAELDELDCNLNVELGSTFDGSKG